MLLELYYLEKKKIKRPDFLSVWLISSPVNPLQFPLFIFLTCSHFPVTLSSPTYLAVAVEVLSML